MVRPRPEGSAPARAKRCCGSPTTQVCLSYPIVSASSPLPDGGHSPEHRTPPPYKQYLSLVSCGPGLWPARYIRHEDRRLPVESSPFWSFAKQHLRQLRGVPASHFPLYLKRCEFRCNSRNENLIPALSQALCSFVPQLGKGG